MMAKPHNPLLAFYGDDFTGSTDALESLSCAGARTVLFMKPPTPKLIERYQPLDAVGLAGTSRTMTPEEMEKELHSAFSALQSLDMPHIHYKVCSTFDSSPTIGSIGKAIDIGADIFRSKFIPLLVAAPVLGRFCTFGNLFARTGIGSDGSIYRLDRHPSMAHHPITPANESDLRLHLARQTSKKIGLIDILQIVEPIAKSKNALKKNIQNGTEVVLFDALKEEHLTDIGQLIDHYATKNEPIFSVGSSGIEKALGNHWIRQGRLKPRNRWEKLNTAESLLIASGSCSPTTYNQIAWALSQGFKEIAIDTTTIAREQDYTTVVEQHTTQAIKLLQQGRSVILHTSAGSDDHRVEKTKEIFNHKNLNRFEIRNQSAKLFGSALGHIIGHVIAQTPIKRIVFAGGDTSGFAAKALGIEALEMIAPLSPGAPLCRVHAPGLPIDGLEVNFKGGQVGRKEYFKTALEGKI